MKIIYFWKNNEWAPGVYTGKGIFDIQQYFQKQDREINTSKSLTVEDIAAFKNIRADALNDTAFLIAENEVEIGPCVPYPPKIICIGLNYRKHAIESGMAIPTVPVVFTKYHNTLTGYGTLVTLGKVGAQFDYEVELGVVIGEKCKDVSKEDALKYVLGYCTANDLSCRDLQFLSSQWLLGKSLDQFLPLGKYLVTTDEAGDPQDLKLSCTLNGELRQQSNTSDMIFRVDEIISFLSKHMTLTPGDLILTGTPEGVIMGMKEKNWLKPGDVVKVEIEKLGYTENQMV
jgi:2-keto-4-pentenoate hydratase/2-oxohepta-3-ene-1,7-dioic acid hydratase in catechol pathway